VAQALRVARQRLNIFVAQPERHIQYAAKVMLKFKLLDAQHMERAELCAWAQSTPYLASLFNRLFVGLTFAQAFDQLVSELVRSGAARVYGSQLHNV
jgi:hypothetical protein